MVEQRMRILMLITRAELGGGQTHVADLLRGLRDDFELHLAIGEKGYLTEVAGELGIETHVLPSLVQPLSPLKDIAALRQCSRLIRDIQPDVIHAHTSKAGFIGRAAARRAGIPSVFTAHTWCFAEGTSLAWKLVGTPLERLAGRWCGKIINVSDANRELALHKRIHDPAKHVTIHNGIADSSLRARPDADATPRIIMLARFAPQKAQSLLIEAVRGIDKPFEVVFVGDGPTRSPAEEQVKAAGLIPSSPIPWPADRRTRITSVGAYLRALHTLGRIPDQHTRGDARRLAIGCIRCRRGARSDRRILRKNHTRPRRGTFSPRSQRSAGVARLACKAWLRGAGAVRKALHGRRDARKDCRCVSRCCIAKGTSSGRTTYDKSWSP